jgi:hypothetical protein
VMLLKQKQIALLATPGVVIVVVIPAAGRPGDL